MSIAGEWWNELQSKMIIEIDPRDSRQIFGEYHTNVGQAQQRQSALSVAVPSIQTRILTKSSLGSSFGTRLIHRQILLTRSGNLRSRRGLGSITWSMARNSSPPLGSLRGLLVLQTIGVPRW
jgi:hypothetical protein